MSFPIVDVVFIVVVVFNDLVVITVVVVVVDAGAVVGIHCANLK